MDKKDEIRLIWWMVMDVAYLFGKTEYKYISDKILEFQYELWDICNVSGIPRPRPSRIINE